MASSDIEKQAVFDARIVQLPSRYAVEKGALSITNAPFKAISASTSQHTYQINVPSQNVFVDRAVDWSADVALTFSVAVNSIAIANEPVIQFGRDLALCAFPLHELTQTMSCSINDTSVVINTDTVLHEVLRLTDYKRNRLVRHCPTMLDRYKSYTESSGAINSPIQGYFEATASDEVPNGAWGAVQFTDPNGVPLGTASPAFVGANYNAVAGVPIRVLADPAGTAYVMYIKFHSSEKLVLSPFIFADSCEWETGLFGINNIQLVCNMKTNASRVLRLNSAFGRTFAVAPAYVAQNAYTNATINVQFLTPSLDIPLTSKSSVPYTEFPRYVTRLDGLTTGTASAPGACVSQQSQTIVLPNIPDCLLIYVKPLDGALTANDADWYFPITKIRINFDNFSGLLSNQTKEQLYQMSAHNGLEMDWNEWSGIARNGQTGGFIQTVGGFLVIKPGQDFGLQSGQAPSLIGNFTLQFELDFLNPTALTSAQLYVIAVNSGFFESLAGSSRIIKGVLSEADIISAEPIMEMSRDGLKRIVGNGFFSTLGSMLSKAVDIYTKTKPVVSAIKGALPEGTIKNVLGKVGYGMPAGAGMAGAGMKGKKSLSDRLM